MRGDFRLPFGIAGGTKSNLLSNIPVFCPKFTFDVDQFVNSPMNNSDIPVPKNTVNFLKANEMTIDKFRSLPIIDSSRLWVGNFIYNTRLRGGKIYFLETPPADILDKPDMTDGKEFFKWFSTLPRKKIAFNDKNDDIDVYLLSW